MPNKVQIAPQQANATGGIQPLPSRRTETDHPAASADLLRQVEADAHNESGMLRFSPEVERRFQQIKSPAQIKHFVWTSLIGLFLYDLFLLSDLFMVPDVFVQSRLIHLGVTVIGLVIIFLIYRRMVRPESIIAVLLLIVGNAVYTANTSRAPDAVFISFTIPLLVVFGNIVLPLPFRYAVAFSVFAATAASWTNWAQQGIDAGARIFAVLLEISMAFYTLIATYRIENGERQAYLLTLREALRGETLIEQNRELSELSETDQLTGIANRRVFDRTLEQLWREHQHSRTPVALLILDIDHFKRLNDTHGHINGDVCLRKVADRLGKLMQAHQNLARYGGEEFAVLLEGEGAYRAEAVADRLRAELETMPVPLAGTDNKPLRITISIGCATAIPRPDLSPADLFVAADKALYRAKHEGRNRVCTQMLEPGDPLLEEESRAASSAKAMADRKPRQRTWASSVSPAAK